MLFTNGNYFIFLGIVFFAYWLTASQRRLPVWLLLVASYYFYALWNPKLLLLVLLISTVDYLTALALGSAKSLPRRKLLLALSIFTDIGALFTFKYFNFFSSSLSELLGRFGWHSSPFVFSGLVLPLGISFITFRSLSYVIDVYRGNFTPTRNYLDYLAFVAFFPTVIAGPIVRASELLPQFRQGPKLTNESGAEALFLIVLGLIKKIAIADFLGNNLVNRVFDEPQFYSSLETLAGIYGYALQLYFDFSAYTDIAIGSALLLGIRLPENFNAPYRARDLRDFWKRWHITLSRWLFDYVYVAIGGLRKRRFNLYRNLVLTFLIGGLWHGPAWTFVLWGALHGLGLSLNHWWAAWRKRRGVKRSEQRWRKAIAVFLTFNFVCLTWVVFRAESLSGAWAVLKRLFALKFAAGNLPISTLIVLTVGYFGVWAPQRIWDKVLTGWARLPSPVQAMMILGVALTLYYLSGTEVKFIYGTF